MESNPVALEVAFEDLNVSFERENSSDELIEKMKENKIEPISTTNKNIRLSNDAVKKSPQENQQLLKKNDTHDDEKRKLKNSAENLPLAKDASKKSSLEIPKLVLNDGYEHVNTGKSRTQKPGVPKNKSRSFLSRLRANTWSPKPSRKLEFDNIGLLHKEFEKREQALLQSNARTPVPPYLLSYTELLYLQKPSKECLPSHEREEVPRFEGKSLGIRDKNQSDTKDPYTPRCKDMSPRSEDKPFNSKHLRENNTCGEGGNVSTVSRNTFEEIKSRHVDTSSRFEDRSHRPADKNPKLKDTNRRVPGYQHPDFVLDPRLVDTRRGSFTNSTIANGRLFLPPRNDCRKKSCCTLSPNCTRRLSASSEERLPRLPSRKVSLIQAGVWQRLNDADSSTSRSRSFTQ